MNEGHRRSQTNNFCAKEIRKVLGQVTLRERQVIELRFGLVDDHDHTLEEVGEKVKSHL